MRGLAHEMDTVTQANVEVDTIDFDGRSLARVFPFSQADFAIAVGVEARQLGVLSAFQSASSVVKSAFLSSTALGPPKVTFSPMTLIVSPSISARSVLR